MEILGDVSTNMSFVIKYLETLCCILYKCLYMHCYLTLNSRIHRRSI